METFKEILEIGTVIGSIVLAALALYYFDKGEPDKATFYMVFAIWMIV